MVTPKLITNGLILIVQAALTSAITFCFYLMYVLFDYHGGFDEFVLTTIIQPIIGLVFTANTLLICFILGLPVRLIKKVNAWWRKYWYTGLLVMSTGMFLQILSVTFFTTFDYSYFGEVKKLETVPGASLAITGWFLTGMGALHLYPSLPLQERFTSWLTRFLN